MRRGGLQAGSHHPAPSGHPSSYAVKGVPWERYLRGAGVEGLPLLSAIVGMDRLPEISPTHMPCSVDEESSGIADALTADWTAR
jgi:hypothetical protein